MAAAALASCADGKDDTGDVRAFAAGRFGATPDQAESAGVVFRSLDAGRDWGVSLQTANILRDVSFSDRRNGWTVGDHAQVWRTTDGGESWRDLGPVAVAGLGLGPEMGFVSVQAISDSRVVVLGLADPGPLGTNTPIIATSDDGGLTWARASITRDGMPLAGTLPNGICIARGGDGIAVSQGWFPAVTLLTSDFGRSWRDESERFSADESTCSGDGTLWALQNQRVLRSSDGGVTWEDRTGNLSALESPLVGVFGLWFDETGVGATTTWTETGGLTILATRSAGDDWSAANLRPVSVTERAGLLDVAFADANHAVGVGSVQTIDDTTDGRPVVYVSDDGARTWTLGDLGELASGFGELEAVAATAR